MVVSVALDKDLASRDDPFGPPRRFPFEHTGTILRSLSTAPFSNPVPVHLKRPDTLP